MKPKVKLVLASLAIANLAICANQANATKTTAETLEILNDALKLNSEISVVKSQHTDSKAETKAHAGSKSSTQLANNPPVIATNDTLTAKATVSRVTNPESTSQEPTILVAEAAEAKNTTKSETLAETVAEEAVKAVTSEVEATESRKPQQYYVKVGGETVNIRVSNTWETGSSSVYINNSEVIRYRHTLTGLTPLQRANRFATRLSAQLQKGVSPDKITVGHEHGQPVIKMGDETLAIVDKLTARQLKVTPEKLATVWAKQLRANLGASGSVAVAKAPATTPVAADLSPVSQVQKMFKPISNFLMSGMASWYGPGFHGRRAADGSRFNQNALTAAHRTLPFGTMVRVINERTGKSCVVRITDRGPFAHGRVIDLSKGAASAIGMLGSGVAKVSLQVVRPQ